MSTIHGDNRMKTALLTKIFRFEAAHHLPGHRGKCARLHGHSYRLEVTLRGSMKDVPGQPDYGTVMDFEDLSKIVRSSVIELLDHQNLDEVTGIHTTAENLTHWIWDRLSAAGFPEGLLYCIRLWETDTGFAEITQEERG